jgi:hypothetical protein
MNRVHPQDYMPLLTISPKAALPAKETQKKPSIKVIHVT